MLAYTYGSKGNFVLRERERPKLLEPTDALVRARYRPRRRRCGL